MFIDTINKRLIFTSFIFLVWVNELGAQRSYGEKYYGPIPDIETVLAHTLIAGLIVLVGYLISTSTKDSSISNFTAVIGLVLVLGFFYFIFPLLIYIQVLSPLIIMVVLGIIIVGTLIMVGVAAPIAEAQEQRKKREQAKKKKEEELVVAKDRLARQQDTLKERSNALNALESLLGRNDYSFMYKADGLIERGVGYKNLLINSYRTHNIDRISERDKGIVVFGKVIERSGQNQQKIEQVAFKYPHMFSTVEGITIGVSTLSEVIDTYGKPKWLFYSKSEYFYAGYSGIEFTFRMRNGERKFPFKAHENKELRVLEITIFDKPFLNAPIYDALSRSSWYAFTIWKKMYKDIQLTIDEVRAFKNISSPLPFYDVKAEKSSSLGFIDYTHTYKTDTPSIDTSYALVSKVNGNYNFLFGYYFFFYPEKITLSRYYCVFYVTKNERKQLCNFTWDELCNFDHTMHSVRETIIDDLSSFLSNQLQLIESTGLKKEFIGV